MGYAAVALPELDLNKNQGSWFASIDFFASMIFAPLGGLMSGWVGRKKIMLLGSPTAALGWILIGASTTNEILFAGRIISSVAIASTMSSPSMSFLKN